MNKKTYLIVLPLLLLAVAAVAFGIRSVTGDSAEPVGAQVEDGTSDDHLFTDAHLIADDHVTVDARVLELFDESEWVMVHIEVAMPPGFEWGSGPQDAAVERMKAMDSEDWALYDKLRHERWDDLLVELGPDYRQLDSWLNASGLEKLRNQPNVRSVVSVEGSSFGSFD